jgi:hypothetical protein
MMYYMIIVQVRYITIETKEVVRSACVSGSNSGLQSVTDIESRIYNSIADDIIVHVYNVTSTST